MKHLLVQCLNVNWTMIAMATESVAQIIAGGPSARLLVRELFVFITMREEVLAGI